MCNLLHKEINNLENISIFGEWCSNYYKILNPFWKDVLTIGDFCASQQIISNNDISSSVIWFNKHMNTKFFKNVLIFQIGQKKELIL